MPVDSIGYTKRASANSNGAYITVYASNGAYVSRHTSIEECTESAIRHAEASNSEGVYTYRFVPPETHMTVSIIRRIPGVNIRHLRADALLGSVNAFGYSGSVSYPSTGADPYDLYASDTQSRGTIPFAVNWPTSPTITSEATVTPATFAANNVNGRRLYLQDGTYTVSSFTGTDKEWIALGTGAVFSNGLRFQGQRFVGRGLRINGGIPHDTGGQDILLDGCVQSNPSGSTNDLWDVRRLAIVNSTISSNGFLLMSLGSMQDFILAGCSILPESGGQAAIRFNGIVRAVLVDNRIVRGGTYATLRIHDPGCSDVWVRNNQFEGGGWQFAPTSGGYSLERVYLWDNAVYGTDAAADIRTGTTLLYANRNYLASDFYSSGSSNWITTAYTGVVSDNPARVGGYTAPPAWDGVAYP